MLVALLALLTASDGGLSELEEFRERTAADELMITTMVHDPADRIRSYELIAEAFGLGASQPLAA